MSKVIADVITEISRAKEKHSGRTPANPDMDDRDRFIILSEEVGEVARALTHDEGDRGKLRRELVQVAATAIASIIGMDLEEEKR